MKPRASAAIEASRSCGVLGATSGTRAIPRESHAARSSPDSSCGRSGTIRPAAPAAAMKSANGSAPRVRTAFAYTMSTTGSRGDSASQTRSTPCRVAPAASARVAAAWITGPSASGSEKGTPSSSMSAPASAHASPTASDVSRSGKPPIRYGISAALRPCEAKAAAILSLKREHLVEVLVAAARQRDQIRSRPLVRQDPRERVRGLERRDDALEPGDALEGVDGVGVGDRDVGRAATVTQLRVLRADTRVVETGRDRMGLEDLALLVLEHRRHRAVEHPARIGRQWGAVPAAAQALPRRLHADQLDAVVVEERRECADRVGAAAHAGDHARREAPRDLEELRARLVADQPLQVAHERRERRRP